MKSRVQILSQIKQEHKTNKLQLLSLFFIVVSTLLLSLLSLADLDWEDGVSVKRGCALFVYGLVFFTALFQAINHVFLYTDAGQRLVKRYKLSDGDVLDISNKQVSAVQALFCCLTGLTCCTYSCRRDILKTSHYISEAYAWFGAAYFAYDIWSMYSVERTNNVHKQITLITYLKTHAIIVGHHVFIGAFGFLVITWLRGGLGDCFFGFVYLMEASTPFVSLRGILSKIHMKQSKIYVINGLLMLAVFFVCRVAMFPAVIYLYARSIHMDYFSAIQSLPTGCKVSISILVLPQIYWFALMLKGALAVLQRGTH